MVKVLFIYTFLVFNVLAGQSWNEITPFDHCKNFKIEFQKEDQYKIRYRSNISNQYIYFSENINDINNLSKIADKLVNISYEFCPFSLNYTEIEASYLCFPRYISTEDFSKDFTTFLEKIIKEIDPQYSCQNVLPLIKLQEKISGLNQGELLTFEESLDFLKIFTSTKNDKFIDIYNSCGGKSHSDLFLKNIILLKAKEACVFPSPPGALSVDEVNEIATNIATKNSELNLIEMSSKKKDITKDSIIQFGHKILSKNIESIFGKEVNPNEMIQNLNSFNILQKAPSDEVNDLSNYILKIDAPFEIIDSGLPHLLNRYFSPMLPEELDSKQKSNFLNKELAPIIKKNYDRCIVPYKERVLFNHSSEYQSTIEHRKKLENHYCQKNLNHCKSKTCGSRINFLTDDSSIKDQNIIQACLFSSFGHGIKPILDTIIQNQFDTIKNLKFSSEEQRLLKINAYNKLTLCADKKFKAITHDKNALIFPNNFESLKKIDTNTFSDVLKTCSKEVEYGLTNSIAVNLVTLTPQIQKKFASENAARDFSKKLVQESLDDCMTAQAKNTSSTNVSAKLCRPTIELKTATNVISFELSKTLDQSQIENNKREDTIKGFESCTNKVNQSLNSQFQLTIKDSNQANNFLNDHSNFIGCVQDGILKTSNLIIDSKLEQLEVILKDKISQIEDFQKLKPKLANMVKDCFKEEISKLKSWNEFKTFTSNDGINHIKEHCTAQATSFALPVIAENEINTKIKSLNHLNLTLISSNDLNKKLAKAYYIKGNKNSLSSTIKEAYLKYQHTYPQNSYNDFLSDLTEKSQSIIVASIKDHLIEKAIHDAKPDDFSFLREELTDKCLNEYFMNFKDELKNLQKTPNGKASKIPDIQNIVSQFLVRGLKEAKSHLRLSKFKYKLRRLCKNPQEYKDILMFASTGIADDLILAQIETKIKDSFTDAMNTQCLNEMAPYLKYLHQGEKNLICTENIFEQQDLNKMKLRLDKIGPDLFNQINFIITRNNDSHRIIQERLNKKFIDKLFYQNKELINFIYNNFDKVIHKDPDTVVKINHLAITSIFNDKSIDSFSSQFLETQLIGAIGLKGHARAKEKLNENLKNRSWWQKAPILKEKIDQQAIISFNKAWSPEGIKKYLAWHKSNNSDREQMIRLIVNNNILPKFDPATNKGDEKMLQNNLTNAVTDHLYQNRIFKNDKYVDIKKLSGHQKRAAIQKNEPEYLSFPEKLANDIKEDITDNIIEDIKDTLFN